MSRRGSKQWAAALLLSATAATAAGATSASADGWLDRVNRIRAASGLTPVVEEPAWTVGIRHHLTYLQQTPKSYFTGQYESAHTENPTSPYYTSDGAAEASYSDLTPGSRSEIGAINGWLTAPFHAIGMLRPNLARIGFAREPNLGAAGLDVIQGLNGTPDHPGPVLFPGAGSTIDLTRYGGEVPDPTETCAWRDSEERGLPLIALLPEQPAPGLTATLTGPQVTVTSQAHTLCVVDMQTFKTTDHVYGGTGQAILGADHAVLLIAHSPLSNGQWTATINQPGRAPVTWTFTVSAPVKAAPPASLSPPQMALYRTGNRVRLTWNKVAGAARYEITITTHGITRSRQTAARTVTFTRGSSSTRVTVCGVTSAGARGVRSVLIFGRRRPSPR